MQITTRMAQKEDMQVVYDLIYELAVFEKAEKEMTNSVEQLEKDGFGKTALFQIILAEVDTQVIGMSFCYMRYSTWKGKRLYLEDLIVTKKHRGRGVGKLLLEKTIKLAKEQHCTGLMWQVLDWNKTAIDFYKTFGARLDNEWVNVHLDV